MNIEQENQAIKDRNARVENDKAWETSKTRLYVIAGLTYLFAALTLVLVKAYKPWLTAFIPAIGFVLSLQTLPTVKRWWLKKKEIKL